MKTKRKKRTCNRGHESRFYQTNRRGVSLMELAVATFLLTALVMPSLATLAQAKQFQKIREDRDELLFQAENAIAQAQIDLVNPGTFNRARNAGIQRIANVTSERIARVRSRTNMSADPSGLATLVRIDVVTWIDQNRNRVLDAGELNVSLNTWAPQR